MKVSVVIPTHNRADNLINAVNSVLEQTYQNIEVIIVSDGSTDNTEEIIKKLKKKDSRIESNIYHPSRGANYARNIGIDSSTGDFVAFLDDDDEWYPDKIESQLKIFSTDEKIGLVYTGKEIIYPDENLKYTSITYAEGDLSRKILVRNEIGGTSTVMVKRNILIEAGCFDEKMPAAQDYDLWIRICQLTRVGVVKAEKVRYFNSIDNNQISSNDDKYIKARKRIQEKYAKYFGELNEDELHTKKMNSYLNSAQRFLKNGKKKLALRNIKKAISTKPTLKSVGYLFLVLFPYKYILLLRKYI